jgi:hypothetical protein
MLFISYSSQSVSSGATVVTKRQVLTQRKEHRHSAAVVLVLRACIALLLLAL